MGESDDPIERFRRLFERAAGEEAGDHTAVTLATADAAGRPSARTVLLKQFDERGFVFFTSYTSRKAREIIANPHAALCFHWPAVAEQVRIEGAVEKVSAAESDAYFASRPRGSQLGAWASRQSEPLDNRALLVARVARREARFLGREVPRPDFWGGFRVVPESIEFWVNKLSRLHDRVLFRKRDGGWSRQRLYP